MVNDKTIATILKITVIQAPIFFITLVIYSLVLYILNDEIIISSSQSCGNQRFINSVFIGVIVLGAIHFTLLIILILVKELAWVILALGIFNIIFNLVIEGLFFKIVLCFTFTSTQIVIARSSLVIVLMVFFICLPCLSIAYSRLTGEKKRFTFMVTILLILPSALMIVLNAVLISRLIEENNF
jgi:hypothetical protein